MPGGDSRGASPGPPLHPSLHQVRTNVGATPLLRRSEMNWDTIRGNWKQWTGKMKSKWRKLTDDDWTTIAGKRDELLGKIQQRYGYQKDQAEKEVDDFLRTLDKP